LLLIESRIDHNQIVCASGGVTLVAIGESLEGRTAQGMPRQIDHADGGFAALRVGTSEHVQPAHLSLSVQRFGLQCMIYLGHVGIVTTGAEPLNRIKFIRTNPPK
jgi:hypothetical protein